MAQPIIEKLGYELVDIELSKKYGQDNLSFFIASNNGINFDDCEKVHRELDVALDELNPSKDAPYILNVSSPGLDRPFKTQRDYARNINKKVEVKLYAPLKGKKLYDGVLLEKAEHALTIKLDKGEVLKLEMSRVAKVTPFVSFEGLEG